MFFSSRVSLSSLVALCHSIRVGLNAGLPLVKVFRQQAKRGPSGARPVMERISDRLERGESLEDVLKDEGRAFPPLFNGLVAVGEQSGGLPEVFKELERYYREQMTLRRRFLALAAWPIFQFFAAIAVITLMLLILGWVAASPETAFDPLGFGVGPEGAIKFLIGVAVFLGGLYGLYLLITRGLRQKATVHRFLLAIPAIGGLMHALALTRFCLAMHLLMKTNLSMGKALRRCFQATGNGAYEACAEKVSGALKGGHDLTEALTDCNIFPEDFLHVVATAEESGQLPEVMGQQSEHYQEVASMRMQVLTMFANAGVWLMVACLIIWCIFRMAMTYFDMIDKMASGI